MRHWFRLCSCEFCKRKQEEERRRETQDESTGFELIPDDAGQTPPRGIPPATAPGGATFEQAKRWWEVIEYGYFDGKLQYRRSPPAAP